MLTTSELDHDTRILNEANTLAKSFQLTVVCRKYPKPSILKNPPFLVRQIDYLHFPIFRLNIFSSFIYLIKAAFKENPDVYHAHDLDGLLCAYLPALLKRKILIYDSHELWSENYPFANLSGIQWLLKPLERFLMLKVKIGITVNSSIALALEKMYHKKFLPLYNFPLMRKGTKAKFKLREKFSGKKIILHLGAADEGRGIEQMIEVASFLPLNCALVFIGGGKIEEMMKEKIRVSRLEKKVFFFPSVPPEEIIATVEQADLGLSLTQKVSKSYYYSLPNKLFQYAGAEIPILGSNFPEFKKVIVSNGIGEVIDPSKPELIAQKIIEMVKAPNQKKYRHDLRGLAQKKYNWGIEAKKLLKFYRALI
ncbi:hypothetical protein A2V71_03565 [Candidatus Berkelbacteria bacterium RBG_13_40_8]|uniref:Glycosyl transferase family 1 domain-containing protein n=1 Tax=Candidatus Berkelbacteria bacterium RBG_13_40_8 TaxID=1797467 RepID=A0A1F5DNM8_9BACT|nr:MAG: hypothetical protein A2V71_03565 [Candidatus Berkelbacteria bacterium RBG_13_40_8]